MELCVVFKVHTIICPIAKDIAYWRRTVEVLHITLNITILSLKRIPYSCRSDPEDLSAYFEGICTVIASVFTNAIYLLKKVFVV